MILVIWTMLTFFSIDLSILRQKIVLHYKMILRRTNLVVYQTVDSIEMANLIPGLVYQSVE